ncbi:Imm59 family immunity protein [Streptococcus ferus]|uniref:Imm59 family immunity protein n=1 Tax=Streptococcus ferus TaxID=1345 RepID=UPI0030810F2E
MQQQKLRFNSKIKDLGYESLRYSIFNEHRPLKWEVRIEFDENKHLYLVYSTMDRASKGGGFQYLNFEEAKDKFIELLDYVVLRNKYYIDNNWPTQYFSPLWDKTDD